MAVLLCVWTNGRRLKDCHCTILDEDVSISLLQSREDTMEGTVCSIADSGGTLTCHVNQIDRTLLTTCYWSGCVTSYRLSDNGDEITPVTKHQFTYFSNANPER